MIQENKKDSYFVNCIAADESNLESDPQQFLFDNFVAICIFLLTNQEKYDIILLRLSERSKNENSIKWEVRLCRIGRKSSPSLQ